MQITNVNTILVTFLMQLGDLILTTPFLTALRKAAPQAKITYLIDEKWLDIVSCNPDVDNIITLDRKGKDKSFSALWKYSKKLQKEKFDLVINLNPSERCSFIAGFSGGKYKTGSAPSLFKLLFDKTLPLDRTVHAADMYLKILNSFGIDDLSNDGLKIIPSEKSILEADALLKKKGIANNDKLIGFNIGSASAIKCWLPERFAKVADYVAMRGYTPVFFGSASEMNAVKETVNQMTCNPIIVTGELSIGGLVATLAKMKLLITNDSGPMHIAVSQKVPVVAIFGPSKPDLYGPYNTDKKIVVQSDPLCPNCPRRMKAKCDDMRCMLGITVEQVSSAVDTILTK